MNLAQPQRVYFLGIGGIGMSALARFLHARGHTVAGYDRTATRLTGELQAEGIAVTTHRPAFQPGAYDFIVFTPALAPDDPALLSAQTAGIPLHKRAAVVGELSRQYRTLAIAGTHGKTTTTALTAHLLRHSGVEATALVGGVLSGYETNYLGGTSDVLVIEADEYDRSFLHLHPHAIALTSIDADHLDVYGSAAEMEAAYQEFIHRLGPNGQLFYEAGVPEDFVLKISTKNSSYGLIQANFRAENVQHEVNGMRFCFSSPVVQLQDLYLPMAGEHNVANACAAICLALHVGAEVRKIPAALASFPGLRRRFEVVLDLPEVTFIDDYAHHPTELKAALTAAKARFPGRQLVAVFQPHLFSRTKDFYQEFGQALSLADRVVLIHIYPAREKPTPLVTSHLISPHVIHGNVEVQNLEEIPQAVLQVLETPSVVLTLGAGDIDTQVLPLRDALQTHFAA